MAASVSDSRATPSSPATKAPTFFLPDFCDSPAVFVVVLIGELVALVIALARQALHDNFWMDLAGSSMFLLWIGLTCSAVLCRSRAWLQTMPPARAAMVAIGLLVLTIGIVSEAVFQVGRIWSGDIESVGPSFFPREHASFVLRNVAVGFIVSALALRYFYVSAEWKRTIELEALARIRALQARIRPHFLFNSMNTIAALTRSSPERAEQAVEDLADLFRASLSDASARISLKDELDIARTHQRIEQLRLGERLTVRWDVDELPMRALVPSLIVQPLLENAVYHGVETLPRGGEVSIVGRRHDDQVHIEVRNPILAQSGYVNREGNRMALENIRQRLELAWPGRARIETEQRDGEFCARLIFPYAGDDMVSG
ncbi:alginate biosynthesis protein AlgZ/FimS [Steroidobacter agaridevorans]|uniref:Alginate biosynthesis protein AlgZ/FimS n=1 Tax=Steroidobacter agaridevorans TaxID=2695856 RepID=A0A829Y5V4_9GAMM|nr:histidine kinase [Steroidobacter agaridevorans]GFE78580.1 alginate biosynthesis protein AlgZ/FimS [Steroidobacter agaridevorans]GFE89487.1 alginate biosynthesis protein AlgZ/FimS [Steroidobacter agaridevorans]